MIRGQPRSTRSDRLFPSTTCFRSRAAVFVQGPGRCTWPGAAIASGTFKTSLTPGEHHRSRSFLQFALSCLVSHHAFELSHRCPGCMPGRAADACAIRRGAASQRGPDRSEEHTSELQSLMRISYAVFCLKKKTLNKK